LQFTFLGKAKRQLRDTPLIQAPAFPEFSSPHSTDTGIFIIPAQTKMEIPGSNSKKQKTGKQTTVFPGTLYLRNEHSGFCKKAGRAELFIGGAELIGMIGLVTMPKDVTKWEEDWFQSISRKWKRTFTQPPVMDTDDAWLNWIAHPIAGSWYYNSVRSQNARWWESFLWSLWQSASWEYAIEGMAE